MNSSTPLLELDDPIVPDDDAENVNELEMVKTVDVCDT